MLMSVERHRITWTVSLPEFMETGIVAPGLCSETFAGYTLMWRHTDLIPQEQFIGFPFYTWGDGGWIYFYHITLV